MCGGLPIKEIYILNVNTVSPPLLYRNHTYKKSLDNVHKLKYIKCTPLQQSPFYKDKLVGAFRMGIIQIFRKHIVSSL